MLDLKTKRDRDDFFIALIVIGLFSWFIYHFIFCEKNIVDDLNIPTSSAMVDQSALDTDGDGIKDINDACPLEKGILESNGCPSDADGDGVNDIDDKCPSVKGSSANGGCPEDSDGDGIVDSKDKCPDLAGTEKNEGCPSDADGDGIYDDVDKCPNRAGKASNGGCPDVVLDEAEKSVLEKAIQAIEFETASANLKPVSIRNLNDIADIMRKYPDYKLDIFGHTDSDGDDSTNLDLSKARAASCFNYLVNKAGISKFRMRHNGFGEKRPIADNDTAAGKEKNRRVEFKLHY